MTTADDILSVLTSMRDPVQASHLMRFFKTGRGEYGEGDRFLGLKVPQTRLVVRECRLDVPTDEIIRLLYSEWHEARLAALLLLVEEMHAAIPRRHGQSPSKAGRRDAIAAFYLRHARQANNWDLVDLSCPKIIGEWLLWPTAQGELPDRYILDCLVSSDNLWEQRIGIVTTLRLIKERQIADTLRLAPLLLDHPHDLIHKATGWMLREVGKVDPEALTRFLDKYHGAMPRTALRYAIERMDEPERRYWLTL